MEEIKIRRLERRVKKLEKEEFSRKKSKEKWKKIQENIANIPTSDGFDCYGKE